MSLPQLVEESLQLDRARAIALLLGPSWSFGVAGSKNLPVLWFEVDAYRTTVYVCTGVVVVSVDHKEELPPPKVFRFASARTAVATSRWYEYMYKGSTEDDEVVESIREALRGVKKKIDEISGAVKFAVLATNGAGQ